MPDTNPAEVEPTTDPSEIAELDAILADIRGPSPVSAETQPVAAEATPEPVAAEIPAEASAETAQAEPEPGLARGLASLARRENKLREQEKAFREKDAQLQQLQAQIAGIRQKAIEDPAAFYREIGAQKVSEIAAQLYYNELGDAAPKEVLERKATFALEQKLAALQQQINEKERLSQSQMAQANALNYLHAQVGRIPASLAYLRAEAAEDSALVARSLYTRITQLAQANALGDATTDEEIAAVAAQSLNDEIKLNAERYQRIHKPAPPAPKTPSPVAEETKPAATKSLSSQATAMTKPRRPPASRDEEIDQLIEDLSK